MYNAVMPDFLTGKRLPSVKSTLVIIIGAAILLRIASALVQGNEVEVLPGTFDQISYDALARQVLRGQGFSFAVDWWPLSTAGEPTSHWSFLYTLYLAAVYAVFGAEPLVARLIQAVVAGVLFPWLTWRIAGRIFGDLVGLVAAGISAVYVYFFYYAGSLMTETFYMIAILWTIDVALRLVHAGPDSYRRWRLWLELGLAVGVAILLRQLFLLFVPLLYLWLWWVAWKHDRQAGSLRSVMPRLAASLAVVIALIAPWTIRNYLVFGQFVPLNTNSGYAFFWANHPIHGASFVSILPDDGPTYQELIPADLRRLDEAALDKALMAEGLRFVVQEPMRYVLLSLSRAKDYFMFWPSAESGLVSNVSRVASFGVFLPFMLYGLVKSPGMARARDRLARGPWRTASAGLALLLIFAASYTAVHLLSWALIRYRLPVDAVLVMFAGAGIVQAASFVSARYTNRVTPRLEGLGNERTS